MCMHACVWGEWGCVGVGGWNGRYEDARVCVHVCVCMCMYVCSVWLIRFSALSPFACTCLVFHFQRTHKTIATVTQKCILELKSVMSSTAELVRPVHEW